MAFRHHVTGSDSDRIRLAGLLSDAAERCDVSPASVPMWAVLVDWHDALIDGKDQLRPLG